MEQGLAKFAATLQPALAQTLTADQPAVGGDPPHRGMPVLAGAGPSRDQGAFADPAQPVHCLHDHAVCRGQDGVQPGEFVLAAHKMR
ncbi:hypothetical protein ACWDYH_23485 [Nocardia goodfellowii]